MTARAALVRVIVATLLAGLLVGASASHAREPGIEPLSAFSSSELVIQASNGRHRFEVWLADSAPRRAQGLMFVEQLAADTGMLFLYSEARTISMWMKNTFIPLDMLFISADGRITRIARNTQPHSLATISSLGPVTAVLEIGGGESERLGIEVGDRVLHAAFR